MLKFTSALQVESIPDEQLDDRFEVFMPNLTIDDYENAEAANATESSWWAKVINTGYSPIVEDITFGTMNFKTDTRRVRTGWYNIPTDIENLKEVSITMFCSVGMLTQYYLEIWKRLIFNPYGEYYNPGSIYKKNIEVYFEGLGSAPSFDVVAGGDATHTMHITLAGCFPKRQDPYKLRYSMDPKRLRLVQTFSVDKILIDMSKVTAAKWQDNATSIASDLSAGGAGIATQMLASIGSNTTAYDIQGLYDAKKVAKAQADLIYEKEW